MLQKRRGDPASKQTKNVISAKVITVGKTGATKSIQYRCTQGRRIADGEHVLCGRRPKTGEA